VVNDLLDNANNFGLWLHSPDSNNKRIFTIDDGGTGTDRDPYLAITVVPEPATLLFLLAGLPLIARRRRSA